MTVDERMTRLASMAQPRVELAQRRSTELLEDISQWRRSEPLSTSLIVKDPPDCGWYVRVDSVDPLPRLEQWGMQIAEIAHHLRSILNTTLTRIVLEEGGTPTKALQFPIALTERAWREQKRRIKILPERVQRAIYASQPSLRARISGTLAQNHVLAVLAWVDNEDKHRLELRGYLEPAWIEHDARIVTPDGVRRRVEPRLTYDWSLAKGSRFVDADTTPHVVHRMEKVTLDLHMEVLFPDELGTATRVAKLIDEMWSGYQDAFIAIIAAWADEDIPFRLLAGSSDFLAGSAFGKAAVDSLAGEGTWDDDYLRRGQREAAHSWLDQDPLVPDLSEPPTTAPRQRCVVWESIDSRRDRGLGRV